MTYYNKGAFVREAVESVLANTFQDLEVVVVDDASTDGGLSAVSALGDPRVRIIALPRNVGRAGAANAGFDAARGTYVAILDADDLMHADRLAEQTAFLDAHPEVGACGTQAQQFGTATAVMTWPATDEECRAKLLFSDPVLYGSAMFRRSVLEAHGLRCDVAWRHPGMDYLFTIRLAPYTRFANLQKPLLLYRLGEHNMRHGRDPVEDRARMYRKAFAHFGIPATEAQVDLQLLLHNLFRRFPTRRTVQALWAWIVQLKRLNREQGLFPVALFEAELHYRWRRLFHHLADRDLGASLAHLWYSKDLAPSRVGYLAKVTARRMFTARG